MLSIRSRATTPPASRTTLALRALRTWGPRQIAVAAAAAIAVALAIGIPTVLIPNPVFGREIPVEPWSYPAWVVTSILAGLLAATYVRAAGPDDSPEAAPASRAGLAGGLLTWFAVGCPVCNKLVLLALGYTGALTWFAPLQPILAAAGVALTAVAVVWRLSGQVACPVVPRATPVAPRG